MYFKVSGGGHRPHRRRILRRGVGEESDIAVHVMYVLVAATLLLTTTKPKSLTKPQDEASSRHKETQVSKTQTLCNY